jgi:hypothetical protein
MALAIALAVALPAAARAQEAFSATHATTLDASQEPGGVDDNLANGIAIFRVDRAAGTLEYRVSVTGLTGITGAHIHRGAPLENGPVVNPLGITDEVHTVAGTASGLSAGFLDSVLAGDAYVNVHTSAHPGGHIRGQIIEMPNAVVPSMSTIGEPHDVTGDSGVGTVVMWIDEASRTARYSIEWSKLTGRATAAHFHLGAPGESGPPVHPIEIPDDSTITGASGVWVMTPQELNALKQGMIYANVHTAINPLGEIRGAVMPADFYGAAVSASNAAPSHADSSGGLGTASAYVVRSPVGGLLIVQSVVDGLTGPISMAHVHEGAIGVNGPIVAPLAEGLTASNWDVAAAPITVADIGTFAASGMYVNYHTARFPAGEIRGQLIPGAMNLSLSASAVPPSPSPERALLVSYDRASGSIVARLPERTSVDGTLELYSPLGDRVAMIAADGDVATLHAGELAPGAYFVRLVDGATVVGAARVAVY